MLRRPFLFLSAFFLALASTSSAQAQGKVHALLVYDTNAGGGISKGVRANQDNLLRVLWKSFDSDARRKRIEWKTLEGKQATPSNIYKYYEDLESTTDDTLFFFYSGHGGLDEKNGHFLDLDSGTVYRDELRGAMLFQKHKQIVIITESCNSLPGQTVGELDREAANWDVVKHLFLDSSGFIDVNAAKPKTFAFITEKGGYFATAFCKNLCSPTDDFAKDDNGRVKWSGFLYNVRQDVKKDISEEKQSHVNFYLGDVPDRHYEKWLELKNNSRHTIHVNLGVTYVDTDTNSFKNWNTGNTHYSLAPGETMRPGWGNNGAVRGSKLAISAKTPDGKLVWKTRIVNMVDSRWGFTAGNSKMTYTYRFDN